MKRCEWANKNEFESYHDNEWGMEIHDDRTLFEFLVLEGAQAGLSWSTILKKREGYRRLLIISMPGKSPNTLRRKYPGCSPILRS